MFRPQLSNSASEIHIVSEGGTVKVTRNGIAITYRGTVGYLIDNELFIDDRRVIEGDSRIINASGQRASGRQLNLAAIQEWQASSTRGGAAGVTRWNEPETSTRRPIKLNYDVIGEILNRGEESESASSKDSAANDSAGKPEEEHRRPRRK